MTAFPAGEEQREFQYKSDCEIYTRTLHGWSRAAMKSSKICPILAHRVFGTVEELFRGCGSNSERLGRAVTLDHHDPVKLLRATVHSKKAVKKETASVAVSYCKIVIGLRPGRLGRLKKLAFLQERDDRLSASGAK